MIEVTPKGQLVPHSGWKTISRDLVSFAGRESRTVPGDLGFYLPEGEHECTVALVFPSRGKRILDDAMNLEVNAFWQAICALQTQGRLSIEAEMRYRHCPDFPPGVAMGAVQLVRRAGTEDLVFFPPMGVSVELSIAEEELSLPDGTLVWKRGGHFLTFLLMMSVTNSVNDANQSIQQIVDTLSRVLSRIVSAPVFISCNNGVFYVSDVRS